MNDYIEISSRLENIFSHAVALDQSGRFKNSIYISPVAIFIVNFDDTVIIKFSLRKSESSFKTNLCFQANDYDSKSLFVNEDDQIVFEQRIKQQQGDLVRTKTCAIPGETTTQIKRAYRKFKPIEKNRVDFHKDVLSLLDSSLSHVEIRGEDGTAKMVQQNIYTGATIEVRREDEKQAMWEENTVEDFEAIGLRYNDFEALFTFQPSLAFFFDTEKRYTFFKSTTSSMKMEGVIGNCLYDELGKINRLEVD